MRVLNRNGLFAYIAALMAVFIWGVFPVVAKDALQYSTVEQFLTIRFLISTLICVFYLPDAFKSLSKVNGWHVLGLALVIISLFYSQTYLLDNMPACWYISAFTLVPVIFLFINPESLTREALIGSTVAIVGMIFFFYFSKTGESIKFWQAILLIFSMLCWVGYSVIAKKFNSIMHDIEFVSIGNFIALIFSFTMWKLHGFNSHPLSMHFLLLTLSASILLLIALLSYSYSLRYQPVFAIYAQYLEPIIGLLFAAMLLNEKMASGQIASATIVILGTTLVGIGTRKISE